MLERLPAKRRAELERALGGEASAEHVLSAWEEPLRLPAKSPVRLLLLQCAAQYLARELAEGKPLDAVARFHLGNGARIERLNWAGDPSAKGLKQSWGLMVNYLYDPKRLDRNRAALSQGRIPVSGAIEDLLS
jgi:malonyl-CoA decarboxylase